MYGLASSFQNRGRAAAGDHERHEWRSSIAMPMNNEPSGSVIPLPCRHSRSVWPTCYGYIRGHRPSREDILWMRASMAHYCESRSLHLARIFHDWEVAPNRVDYLGLRHALDNAGQPGVHSLLLGDLDFIREPSPVLAVLAETVIQAMPGLQVRCFVDERAFEGLIELS